MGQTHQREAAIFDAAMELPPEQRAAHLDHACGGDAALRQRMESLLKACESSCDFLDSPADPGAAEATNVLPPSFEKVGDRIGRYKLLQQIGEGGCGVVYMAEQEEPVSRRIALKVIKLGLDTKSVIARFEAERQALALMDHANIAKVLDAGTTETGRPYFVMELVRGLKITEYCDEARLSTKARLDLFIQVCQAIQHAHQKGIIHRDIKPSNILVTINDGVAVPKVIDFGIAKATGGLKLTDKTVFTAFDQFIGTPAYMSPEQAVLTSLDIDTRSDIYALGVLLYEMLTGKTPFDAQELLAIGLDEMRRTIRETEPPRPSTRLSTLAQNELSTTAQRRGIEAPKLVSELRGDLDWIVMKALEKDRARRYETANGLAADIQRHLKNEPVVACPPNRVYQFQKLVRRNKLAFSAATAVAAALLVGVIVSAWQAERARRAERVAKSERDSAEAVLKFFQEKVLAAGRPEGQEGGLGKDVTLRKAIDAAEPQITTSFQNRPLVEAAIRETIGGSYSYLGETALEIQQRERVLSLRRRHLGTEHHDTLVSMNSLGTLYVVASKLEQGLALLEEALKLRKSKPGSDHPDTLGSMKSLALAYQADGKLDQALPLWEEAFELRKAKLGPDHPDTLNSMANVAEFFVFAKNYTEAETWSRNLLARIKHRNGTPSAVCADALDSLGQKFLKRREWAKAELVLRDCLAIREKIEPDAWGTFSAKSMLGDALLGQRKFDEAQPLIVAGYDGLKKQSETKTGFDNNAKDHLTAATDRLVILYSGRPDLPEAAKWKAEIERVRRLTDQGAIRRWLILAPIALAAGQWGARGLELEQLSNEANLRPRPGDKVSVGGRDLVWREYALRDYAINFNELLGEETRLSVAYAVCYVQVTTPRKGLVLKVGSDDQARVYLNGQKIYENMRGRALRLDEDTIPDVELQAGLNAVVFKVVNDASNWRGSLRFADKEDQVVQGIKITLEPD